MIQKVLNQEQIQSDIINVSHQKSSKHKSKQKNKSHKKVSEIEKFDYSTEQRLNINNREIVRNKSNSMGDLNNPYDNGNEKQNNNESDNNINYSLNNNDNSNLNIISNKHGLNINNSNLYINNNNSNNNLYNNNSFYNENKSNKEKASKLEKSKSLKMQNRKDSMNMNLKKSSDNDEYYEDYDEDDNESGGDGGKVRQESGFKDFQTMGDTDYIDQYIEFDINNNQKNLKECKIPNNKISTTKYNVLTFLPKGLLFQFSRLANVYFLFTAIIQSIPLISPLSSLTAIVPLIFVLGISLIREFIEDLARHKYDSQNNNEEIIVFRENQFIISKSESLRVGEIILIYENRLIPADMVLLDTGLKEGTCYVETSSLDGEKALKLKIANKNTNNIIRSLIDNCYSERIEKEPKLRKLTIEGAVKINMPNPNLNEIDGKLELLVKENDKSIRRQFFISNKEFLLKGSILKNTNWIIGVVAYTGMNNKIILNSKKPRMKFSQIETSMNHFLVFVFLFLLICCIVCSILHHYGYTHHQEFYDEFILLTYSPKLESFICFFTYFLLLNTMIPISLIVSIEIIKIIQGIFIGYDVKLYSHLRHCFCKAKTVSINEELGNVNFIFSDKTGTLTMNQLNFKYCIINQYCYKYENSQQINSKNKSNNNSQISSEIENIKSFGNDFFISYVSSKEKELRKLKLQKEESKKNLIDNEDNEENEESIWVSKNKDMKNKIKNSNNDPNNSPKKLSPISSKSEEKEIDVEKKIILLTKEIDDIKEFWKALALTNECMVNKNKKGESQYTSTSPDDLELVKAAANQRIKLTETAMDKKNLEIGKEKVEYEVLNVLGFSSERKRMSVIFRDQDKKIKLYIKGADCEIFKRLSDDSIKNKISQTINNNLEIFSKYGFRTLMVGHKTINEKDYELFLKKLHKDELNINKKQKWIDKCYDDIEQQIELIGGTVVEDELQDKVPETIRELTQAGIKIWVLTGDKMDTLENIGISCNLLSRDHKIFKLKVLDGDEHKVNVDSDTEMSVFFNQFRKFIEDLAIENNLIININQNEIGGDNRMHGGINLNASDNSDGNSSQVSNASEKLNLIYFHTLRQRGLLKPFSILIEAPILCGLFRDEEQTERFFNVSYYARTVICCRVSPIQKSLVVQKMKIFDKHAITLAIGDGGNDVSMIMEANIGIGVFGEEGMSAAQASDFAIGEFKYLKRLLFFHGRVNLLRISKMILYFFYKNFVFTMLQFYFSFSCLSSGQTLVDDWYITCYNLIFTAFPLCVAALTDIDVKNSDGPAVRASMPQLYRENRDTFRVFTIKNFSLYLIKGSIISLIIYLFCNQDEVIDKNGHSSNIWYLSLENYICILLAVSTSLYMQTFNIVIYLPLVIIITTFLFFIIFLFLNHYGFLLEFNSKASVFSSLSTLNIYVVIFLVIIFNFLVDFIIRLLKLLFSRSLASQFMRNKDINSQALKNYNTFSSSRSGKVKLGIKKEKSNQSIDLSASKISINNKKGFGLSSQQVGQNDIAYIGNIRGEIINNYNKNPHNKVQVMTLNVLNHKIPGQNETGKNSPDNDLINNMPPNSRNNNINPNLIVKGEKKEDNSNMEDSDSGNSSSL